MKKQVLYIHGGEAFKNYNTFLERLKTKDIWDLPSESKKVKWTGNFADNLGSDYEVFMPAMPNKQNAKYEEWEIWFERHFEHLHDGVILIGCSLGAMFLAKYISENKLPFKVKSLYLMAAVVEDEKFNDEDCGDFMLPLDDMGVIKDRVDRIFILHSKDDFLVPFEHASKLKNAIPGSKIVVFEDKNHFLIEEFPELIEHIKNNL